ncbi:MAG: Do family serine endopeptidase [SAR324 cluster bacterium]|nr:Do family serine endopeptidase [SAR324 cluster bacterium]MBL7034737.1 Do family serine endopeptidase [SAR324 cluster bacterium]
MKIINQKYQKRFAKWSTLLFVLMITGTSANSTEINEQAVQNLIQNSKARAVLVEHAREAVVHIRVEKSINTAGRNLQNPSSQNNPGAKQFKQQGLGSGSIVSEDGYILTNNHVVGDADRIVVKLHDGREFEAKLIGTDPPSDIAVIQIEGKELHPIQMGDSSKVKVGESAIAIGNPFGLTQTVTLGIISAKGRSNIGITDYENFIQTDAAINPGNSGGPLISLEGKLIGVNTAIFSKSGGYQGIGFAVPVNMARQIMQDLIEVGRVSRGWLGVGIQDITHDLAQAFGTKNTHGSIVTKIISPSPAESAGLKEGDIVVSVNQKNVRDSSQLKNYIAEAGAGIEVELEIIRNGKTEVLKVVLDERDSPPAVSQNATESASVLGLLVQDLSLEVIKRLGYDPGTGVVITDVKPGSPAAQVGLQAGMVIAEVNRQTVNSKIDYQNAIKHINLEKGVLFLLIRPEGSQYIIIKSK